MKSRNGKTIEIQEVHTFDPEEEPGVHELTKRQQRSVRNAVIDAIEDLEEVDETFGCVFTGKKVLAPLSVKTKLGGPAYHNTHEGLAHTFGHIVLPDELGVFSAAPMHIITDMQFMLLDEASHVNTEASARDFMRKIFNVQPGDDYSCVSTDWLDLLDHWQSSGFYNEAYAFNEEFESDWNGLFAEKVSRYAAYAFETNTKARACFLRDDGVASFIAQSVIVSIKELRGYAFNFFGGKVFTTEIDKSYSAIIDEFDLRSSELLREFKSKLDLLRVALRKGLTLCNPGDRVQADHLKNFLIWLDEISEKFPASDEPVPSRQLMCVVENAAGTVVKSTNKGIAHPSKPQTPNGEVSTNFFSAS